MKGALRLIQDELTTESRHRYSSEELLSSLFDDLDELELPDELDESESNHDDEGLGLELGLGLGLGLGLELYDELDELESYDDKLDGPE